MNKLSGLKDWFFLDSAATQLSKHLNETWESSDVLQAVLEEKLTLSWYVEKIQLALPSGTKLNEPDFLIDDMTDSIRLKGIYRLVIEDSELNMCAGYNVRKEWLERLLFSKPAADGMTAMTGFLVEDVEGRLFRPLEYIEAGSSGCFGAGCDGDVTPMTKGYYPQILMPDISELIIRKTDLELFLSENPLSLENNKTRPLVEFKNMRSLSYNDITIVFIEESRVEIIANKEKKIFTLGELGLINKNTGKTNANSVVLIGYAAGKKVKSSKAKVKQRVNNLIKKWLPLLKGEPFYVEGNEYSCNMIIKNEMERSSERARRDAKHVPLKDDTNIPCFDDEDDAAGMFLKKQQQ